MGKRARIKRINEIWDVFGEKNGAATFDEFRSLIGRHLKGNRIDPMIGCVILTNPFFLKIDDWIENPPGWSPAIVRGKMYDTATSEGANIWNKMAKYFSAPNDRSYTAAYKGIQIQDVGEKYGEPVLIKPRLGQSAFRMLVTEAYQRRCAITGENTLVVLDAAHIVPYSNVGTTRIYFKAEDFAYEITGYVHTAPFWFYNLSVFIS